MIAPNLDKNSLYNNIYRVSKLSFKTTFYVDAYFINWGALTTLPLPYIASSCNLAL